MDEGDFAMEIASVLENDEFVRNHGWLILGLDIGEIEVRTNEGEKFRLTVSRIADDE